MDPSLVMTLKSFIYLRGNAYFCLYLCFFFWQGILFYLFCLFYSTFKYRLLGGITACIMGAILLYETVNEWIPTELSQRIEISGIQGSQQVSTRSANLTCCSTCKSPHFFLLCSHPCFLLLSLEKSLRSSLKPEQSVWSMDKYSQCQVKTPCSGTREDSQE